MRCCCSITGRWVAVCRSYNLLAAFRGALLVVVMCAEGRIMCYGPWDSAGSATDAWMHIILSRCL